MDPNPVRDEVKRMSGHANEQEMADSLPENTMLSGMEEAPRQRRPRRTKAEMDALRGQATPSADPLMADPVYARAVQDMQAFGGSGLVKGAFSTAAVAMKDEEIALQTPEEKRLDGYFYVMSKKYNVLDPTGNWFTMALYFFGMLGSFIFARVAKKKGDTLVKQFQSWFSSEETKPDPDAKEGMDK